MNEPYTPLVLTCGCALLSSNSELVMALNVRFLKLVLLILPDLTWSSLVAEMPSPGCGTFTEDKGHLCGGALSMKWEGRGPLLCRG